MRVRLVRAAMGLACLALLAGCETVNNAVTSARSSLGSWTNANAAPDETTGSVGQVAPNGDIVTNGQITVDQSGLTGQPIGADPNDDVELGKRQFREQNFGLAEKHFRRAVEKSPGPADRDAEAWLGLAATYDRLKRFDLADRAYAQAIKIAGPNAAILNNQGYSYILRGDYRRARQKLAEARGIDPANPYIQNNMDLLERSARGR